MSRLTSSISPPCWGEEKAGGALLGAFQCLGALGTTGWAGQHILALPLSVPEQLEVGRWAVRGLASSHSEGMCYLASNAYTEELLPEQLAKFPQTLPVVWLDTDRESYSKCLEKSQKVSYTRASRKEGPCFWISFVEHLSWEFCTV